LRLTALGAATAATAALACANVESPPGGPPDIAPPQIVAVQPESGSVARELRGDAVVRFDEVIDEMAGGGPGGAGGLSRFVSLSPVAGPVRVRWARSAIRVRPEEGWKPGRVYRLEVRRGILDLRRNVLDENRLILFSTGPAIPEAELRGTALHWVEQRVLAQAVIHAAPLPDTVPYATLADSAGEFRLAGIPPGRYRVYAIQDQNHNGQVDRREAYDSAEVVVDSVTGVVLWAFTHDSAGPRLRTADYVDSLSARLSFSLPLDPAAPLDTTRVRIVSLPDSAPVGVAAIYRQADFDSLLARERDAAAAADSARRAAADSPPPPPSPAPGAAPVAPRARPPAGAERAGGRPPPTAAGDTAAIRALLRRRPAPVDRVVVRVLRPFTPGARYVVRVSAARNLNGATADGQAVLAIPERRPAPADSTARP
jgi:hypothetical protein